MKAITIRAPWSLAVAAGVKTAYDNIAAQVEAQLAVTA